MAPVLKTGDPQGSVGSNPTLSVLSKPSPETGSQPNKDRISHDQAIRQADPMPASDPWLSGQNEALKLRELAVAGPAAEAMIGLIEAIGRNDRSRGFRPGGCSHANREITCSTA